MGLLEDIGKAEYKVETDDNGQVIQKAETSDKEVTKEDAKVEKESAEGEETKVEDTKADGSEGKVEQKAETPDYLKKISEYTGREFSSEDDLKTFFEETNNKVSEASKYQEEIDKMKSSYEAYSELEKYLDEQREKYDPLNTYFNGDQDKMKKYMISQSLVSQGKNPQVVDKLINSNLEQMSALDLLSLDAQLESTRLSGKDEDTKRMILSDVGVDVTDEDFDLSNPQLTPTQQAKLDAMAGKIEVSLKNAIKSVEIPETANPIKEAYSKIEARKAKTTELKESWSDKGLSDRISKELDKVEIEGLEFDIDDKEKGELLTAIQNDAARHGKEVNEDNISLMVQAAKDWYVKNNVRKLLSIAMQQREAAVKEEFEKKVFNGKKPNTNEAPENRPDSTKVLEEGLRKIGAIR